MRFLNAEDEERFAAERGQFMAEVDEKIVAMDLPQFGIHELVMLRDGFNAQANACEEHIANSVAHLRFVSASWAEIGKALGISKQAAQQRYGDKASFTVHART